ncbi:hypothetical protein, partial [Haloarcula vallismortis]
LDLDRLAATVHSSFLDESPEKLLAKALFTITAPTIPTIQNFPLYKHCSNKRNSSRDKSKNGPSGGLPRPRGFDFFI